MTCCVLFGDISACNACCDDCGLATWAEEIIVAIVVFFSMGLIFLQTHLVSVSWGKVMPFKFLRRMIKS